VIGVAWLLKRRQVPLVLACLAPLALNFVAAAAGRYPYGGHVRLAMYFAPACCVLAGLGVTVVIGWMASRHRWQAVPFLAVLGLLAMLPIGSAIRDVCRPYRARDDVQARDFARWFWPAYENRGEVACLKSDLVMSFSAENFCTQSSAIYRCNQRIYSPRHAGGNSVDWKRISADWPLWCVEFRSPSFRYEGAASRAWQNRMQSQFELAARKRFVVPNCEKGRPQDFDYVDVYEFLPRPSLAEREGGPRDAARR